MPRVSAIPINVEDEHREGVLVPGHQESPSRTRAVPLWLRAALGTGALVVVGSLLAGGSPPPPPPAPTPVPTPVPTPEAQGVVNQLIDRLFEDAPAPADKPGQEKRVRDYRDVKLLAARHGAVMPTGCYIAQRAYQVDEYLLGKESWGDCYLDGQVSLNDRRAIAFYAAILRNLGRHWAEDGLDEQTRYQGLAYLVACVQVVGRYGINVAECRQDLLDLIGDQAKWPQAAPSPVLLPPAIEKGR